MPTLPGNLKLQRQVVRHPTTGCVVINLTPGPVVTVPVLQERCINAGTLTVNYEKVDVDYKLKHNDLLANIVHR